MYLRRSAILKYFIACLVGAVLYCEWFLFVIQPYYWNKLECREYDTSCLKILLIGDPQIQGDLAAPFPINYFFNWDSDRYLQSTFSAVLKHFKPDVLVFMGDLMDEGSIATMYQFHGYVKRLLNIFEVDYPIRHVWIPGDNDIGGENEPIKKDKVIEFEKVFEQPSIISIPNHNISFYKINVITQTYPKIEDGIEDKTFKIAVSHYPIAMSKAFIKRVNKEVRPDVYFCAHEHESKYVKQARDLSNRVVHRIDRDTLSVQFQDEVLYEILVPTCSYRMGTPHIGYGGAVIENNNRHMRYAVFWSPQRFPYLFFYLGVLVILILYAILYCAARLFYRLKTVIRSSDMTPLLQRI